MKKVITALSNPVLNDKLREENEFKILSKDIQYQDGIFEILEKYEDVDYLILSQILLGENTIIELIKKILEKNNKIKIIIILENKEKELEKNLQLNGVKKIFFNNEVEIEDIINYLKNDELQNEQYNELKHEIDNLKELLLKNNNNLNIYENNEKSKIKFKKNNKLNNSNNIKKINKKKIISITGTGGVGKSIVIINIANIFKEKNNKILIIDFDILNNSLHTILGVNKYSKKIKNKLEKNDLIKNKININNLLFKINKKVDLISGINLIFDSEYKISSKKVKFILEELKEKYDVIIIDTSSECFFDYIKNILDNSDLILLEGNLSEIKKANNLLKIYTENWNIKKEKINIIINKYNENAINEKIIKNIFSEYEVLGKIKFNKKYNLLINKNYKEKIFSKKIKKDYKNISNKIIKIKNKNLFLKIDNIYKKYKYKIKSNNNKNYINF